MRLNLPSLPVTLSADARRCLDPRRPPRKEGSRRSCPLQRRRRASRSLHGGLHRDQPIGGPRPGQRGPLAREANGLLSPQAWELGHGIRPVVFGHGPRLPTRTDNLGHGRCLRRDEGRTEDRGEQQAAGQARPSGVGRARSKQFVRTQNDVRRWVTAERGWSRGHRKPIGHFDARQHKSFDADADADGLYVRTPVKGVRVRSAVSHGRSRGRARRKVAG